MLTQKPLVFGGVRIPAGAYSLFFVLNADDSATLLVNREIGQWGIDPYHFDSEFARIPLNRAHLETPVHQFTIVLDKGDNGGGLFKMNWENRQYWIPYTVEKEPQPKLTGNVRHR